MYDLNTKIINSVFWNAVKSFFDKGLQILVKMVLVRILVPEHFGLIGMAVVFTGLVQTISDAGLGASLIRSKKEFIKEIHYHSVFWASLLLNAVVFFVLAFAIGPFAAWFYDEELLKTVVPLIGFTGIINSFTLIPRIVLMRSLGFKSLTILQLIAHIFSGITAVVLALNGFGVWSLVFQGLASATIFTFLIWKTVKWTPKFVFSLSALREVLRYGLYESAKNVFTYLTHNVDYLIIGKVLGASVLGVYTLAFMIVDIFRKYLLEIVNQVMFPVYGIIQDDRKRIKKYYLLVVKYYITITLIFVVPLIVFAEPIVLVFLGDKWTEAIAPIQIMGIASVFSFSAGASKAIQSIGRIDISFHINWAVSLFFTIPAIILAAYNYGITGVAVVVVLDKIILIIVHQHYMRVLFQVNAKDLITTSYKAIISAIFLAIVSVALFASLDMQKAANLLVALSAICTLGIIINVYTMKNEILTIVNNFYKKKVI